MKNQPVLNFGKYKNQPIKDVPRDYLEWLRGSAAQLIKDMDLVLAKRNKAERQFIKELLKDDPLPTYMKLMK
jgi:uncharacterized protein (DUF3820 family)